MRQAHRPTVALISPVLPPDSPNGIGSATLHLALGLVASGVSVTVYTWLEEAGAATPAEGCERLVFRRIQAEPLIGLAERAVNRGVRSLVRLVGRDRESLCFGTTRGVRAWLALRGLVMSGELRRFSYIEAPEWGGAASALFRRPLPGTTAARLHGSLYSQAESYWPHAHLWSVDVALANSIERRGLVRANVVLAPSESIRQAAIDRLRLENDVVVLPNCVDVDFIRGYGARGPASRASAEIKVVFAGRMDRMKGAHILDQVVGILRSRPTDVTWHFQVCGTTSAAQAFPNLARSRGEGAKVTLLGVLSSPDLYRTMLDADVFCFPSQSENCPMAVLEAMACGLPVVASRTGGIPEIIEEGRSGLLCAKDDAEAFAAALESLKNSERRAGLAGGALAAVSTRFSARHIAERWLSILESAGTARAQQAHRSRAR